MKRILFLSNGKNINLKPQLKEVWEWICTCAIRAVKWGTSLSSNENILYKIIVTIAILKKTYSLPRPVVRAVISDVVDVDFASVKKIGTERILYWRVSTSQINVLMMNIFSLKVSPHKAKHCLGVFSSLENLAINLGIYISVEPFRRSGLWRWLYSSMFLEKNLNS